MRATILSSGPEASWVEGPQPVPTEFAVKAHLRVCGESAQAVRGFGGSFNELGMAALLGLGEPRRREALDWLFSPEKGCGFGLGRIPVGANDFALDWYSCDETDDDFAMESFSIERDRRLIIPFIREALERSPEMRFFCSPWSPPTWMKEPRTCSRGRLRPEREYRAAYALYLARFVEAYSSEGIAIDQVFVQNEPNSDHPFPCCRWTPEETRSFIADQLAPIFAERGVAAEIWLGTMEKGDAVGWEAGEGRGAGRSDFRDWIWPSFARPEMAAFIKGIGFQWDGKAAMQRSRAAFPDLPIIGTECECGDGKNSWEHAHYVFDLMWSYFANGAEAFMHWNLALGIPGVSTWGWPQNSLLSVDGENGLVTRNPEYWLMRHLSAFVPRGSRVRAVVGPWAPFAIAFERPDGSLAVVIANPDRVGRLVTVDAGRDLLACELPAYSFSTLAVHGGRPGKGRER